LPILSPVAKSSSTISLTISGKNDKNCSFLSSGK